MKKVFMSTFALSSLALSTFALASCGVSHEVEVKDSKGNTYIIVATEDSEAVTKAAVLLEQNAINQNKNYAVSIDANVDANVDFSMMGLKGTAVAKAKAYLGATIGTQKYKTYWKSVKMVDNNWNHRIESYSDNDIAEAEEFLKQNLGFLASFDANVEFSNFSVDEESAYFDNYSQEEIQSFKEKYTKLNNKSADAKGRAFLYDGEYYEEIDTFVPKELIQTEEDAKKSVYSKSKYTAPDISNKLRNIQTASYEQLIEKYTYGLTVLDFPVSSILKEMFIIPDDFLTSEDYQKAVDVVKALGIKISSVNDNNVTFTVDIALNKVLEVLKPSLGETQVNALLPSLGLDKINKDTTFLSLSVTYDAVKNTVTQVKLSSEALDSLGSIVSVVIKYASMMTDSSSIGMASMPFESLSGNFTFEANFKVDGDVSFNATPDANKTYVDMGLSDLPFLA